MVISKLSKSHSLILTGGMTVNMKLNSYHRNRIMDSLYREETSIKAVKAHFVLGYRIPARKAKQMAEDLLKEGIEYWNSDVYDDL